MKVLFINSVCGIRSTGRIVTDLAQSFMAQGHECRIAYGRETVPDTYKNLAYRLGSQWDVRRNALKARLLDNEAFNAEKETKRFIEWANDYDPDVLWLHNLHGYYINIELLFHWIKSRPHMQVKWTLHDCWAFTGHCAHFTVAQCYKWKTQCAHCPQKKTYPSSLIKDNSHQNYCRKKNAFTGVKQMTILTPSHWLANLVKQSFLKEYPVEVCYNTVNKAVFRPIPSNFREKHGLTDKIILLGVASAWSANKGLNDFITLSMSLDARYAIVLVGLSEKQTAKLPKGILAIPRTNNVQELAEIYTAADLFVNPSKEETFGLTTLEALACGTEAIVYQDTACEEVVEGYGGKAVPQNVGALQAAIEARFR